MEHHDDMLVVTATMDDLMAKLKAIEEIQLPLKDDTLVYFDDLDADGLVEDTRCIAEELLITGGGKCDWDNINSLKVSGYDVTAGEKDHFGWLSGCIHTSKGVVVYG